MMIWEKEQSNKRASWCPLAFTSCRLDSRLCLGAGGELRRQRRRQAKGRQEEPHVAVGAPRDSATAIKRYVGVVWGAGGG